MWQVVAMAALNGMDTGRRTLTKIHLAGTHKDSSSRGTQQHNQPPAAATDTQQRLALAQAIAVNKFWSNIQDFAILIKGRPPSAWIKSLPTGEQPFFRLDQQPPEKPPSSQRRRHADRRGAIAGSMPRQDSNSSSSHKTQWNWNGG